jgi:hypothetical protein
MKKTKAKTDKMKEHLIGFKNVTIVLSLIIAVLTAGLVMCASNLKTHHEKEYLALYETLMKDEAEHRCPKPEDREGFNYVCEMTKYGVTADNNPYMSFVVYEYDANTHEKTGNERRLTLYYQHQPTGYSEAIGYD